MFVRGFLVVASLALHCVEARYEAFAATSECCNKCIGKPSSSVYDYDPVIYEQCTNVTNGICCFDCGSLGDPQYGDTVSYGDDGVTALVTAGNYLSFTWSGVENVTYVSLKTGQKKTVTPSISDTKASMKSDTFLICAKAAGTIYFRGWGSDTCREASMEHAVTVKAGDSKSDTCDANDVKVDTASSSAGGDSSSSSSSVPADSTVAECNPQRASIQVVDGTRTCVCVSDWTNPPECDRWPVWKWLVTIGGGVAALLSIIISVRAFLQGRKKKEAAYQENLEPKRSDVETLEVTPDSGYHGHKYDPDTDRTTERARKPDEREFTL